MEEVVCGPDRDAEKKAADCPTRGRLASLVLADSHVRCDGRAGEVDLGNPRDVQKCAVEAGCIAGGEQLLGVCRGASCAAELLRDRELEIEHAVVRTGVAAAAVAGGGSPGRVKSAHACSLVGGVGSDPCS